MAEDTKIQWCHHTFNPWRGCTKVSAGCANCYAEKQAKRNPGVLGIWGDNGTRVVAAESYWKQPLKWDAAAKAAGERRRVFCASMADVFEDRPELEESRRRLFSLIDSTHRLDWLLLTKRPENVLRLVPKECPFNHLEPGDRAICRNCKAWEDEGHRVWCKEDGPYDYLRNCHLWLGTSTENQATADERIPHLLSVPAAVRFLSVEPLLGPVDLTKWLYTHRCIGCNWVGSRSDITDEDADEELLCPNCNLPNVDSRFAFLGGDPPEEAERRLVKGDGCCIDWVIVGGESGPGARPCDVRWILDIVRQCKEAGVPCFVKQLGANPHDCGGCYAKWPWPSPCVDPYRSEPIKLRDPKGGDMSEWPEALRVREFPQTHGGVSC